MLKLKTEQEFLEKIDKSFVEAARVLELADLPDQLGEADLEQFHEDRHHCGTCMVRTVMDVVWPTVEEYVNWLKGEGDVES